MQNMSGNEEVQFYDAEIKQEASSYVVVEAIHKQFKKKKVKR